MKRIGLTMRTEPAPGYAESRDAIAEDWKDFINYALAGITWIPIPNIAEDAVKFIVDLDIDAVILSGGNSIGTSPARDITEKAIITFSLSRKMPVFGVCRGLQLIQVYFGGEIALCPENSHTKKHLISLNEGSIEGYQGENQILVNSYHKYGIKENSLNDNLLPLAVSNDGWVERIKAKNHPIEAVQWHPERERPFRDYDRLIIRNLCGLR